MADQVRKTEVDSVKELSIVDDDVLEVFELVEDNPLEECMMLVNKMSETSLIEIEKEKENLTRLLREADKEVSQLKQSFSNVNTCNDEVSANLKREIKKTEELEEELRNSNDRIVEMQDFVSQSKEEYFEMEKKYYENTRLVEETHRLLREVLYKKTSLEREVESLKVQRENAERELATFQKRLREEQERGKAIGVDYDERLLQVESELQKKQEKLSTLEHDFKSQIEQLQEKLNLEKGLNRSLADEADECVLSIGDKLDSLEKRNLDAEREKISALARLEGVESELKKLKEKLKEGRIAKDQKLKENEKSLQELRKTVHAESLKNTLLRKERADLGDTITAVENKSYILQSQLKELQENYDAVKKDLVAYEENEAGRSATESDENADRTSWANRVEEEEDEPEGIETKYANLETEYNNLTRQFTQLRKHRNDVLRQNNELRHQAQMAVVQLASTNRRFSKHMEQLKMQLDMAERVYEEKLFECNLLEIQVQHLMQQANASNHATLGPR